MPHTSLCVELGTCPGEQRRARGGRAGGLSGQSSPAAAQGQTQLNPVPFTPEDIEGALPKLRAEGWRIQPPALRCCRGR